MTDLNLDETGRRREPLDLTRVDELLGRLSGAYAPDRYPLTQELASWVTPLVAEVERLRAELDRRQAVVDAAEQVVAAGQLSMDTPGVDVETIQHSTHARLAEAVEALGGGAPVEQQYLIWSQHHEMWWGPNGRGYKRHVTDAGRYALADTAPWLRRGCGCCPVPEVVIPAPPAALHGIALEAYVRDALGKATNERVTAGKVNKFATCNQDIHDPIECACELTEADQPTEFDPMVETVSVPGVSR